MVTRGMSPPTHFVQPLLPPSISYSPGGPPPYLSFRSCAVSARCCYGGAPPPLSPGCMLGGASAWSGCPLYPLGARGKRRLLCGGSPPPFLRLLATGWGIPLPGQGVLLHPLAARGKRVLLSWGTPPPPSWWMHTLILRCCSGGFCSSYLSSVWLLSRIARCPFRIPAPVSLPSVFPLPMVSLGLFLLP